MSTFTRRRVLVPLLVLSCTLVYIFSPSSSSSSSPSSLNSSYFSPLTSLLFPSSTPPTPEIHGLLHFVVNNPDKILVPLSDHADDEVFDPQRPIQLRVYAEDGAQVDPISSARDWAARADKLDRETPLIVFSKTYCAYSRRAKELLASYDLDPPPRIIEVDQRDDGALIKAILARLTGRSTFPNVVLKGASIGGADTLLDLHSRRKLAPLLRRAGIKVRADVGAR